MCGIAGVVSTGQGVPQLREAVTRMTQAIAHRGPNDAGFFDAETASTSVVLGHRRLSVLDLSDRAHQPMRDDATGLWIVYNGEVFNFEEVRNELGAHNFVSTGDTEVVLKAYARWGIDAFRRFRGMFAIALWDPRDQSLLLVRDSLGIKPLYYGRTSAGGQERLWFGSELNAFLANEEFARKLNPAAISSYLWNGFVPGPGTMLCGVQLLPAGTVLRIQVRNGRLLVPSAQRFRKCPTAPGRRVSVEEVHAELERAVRMRLVSDVPLGVFLSGGVDSSVVTALAQRAATTQIRTFTIGFEEAQYDETRFARNIANKLGTQHEEVRLSKSVFAARWREALASLDQPTFDGINTYFVSRAVREAGLTVALAGTGGDELFGGYSSFRELPRLRQLSRRLGGLPPRVARGIGQAVSRFKQGVPGQVRPQTRWGKLEDVFAADGDPSKLYQVSHGLFTRQLLTELDLKPAQDIAFGLGPELRAELAESCRGLSELAAIGEMERTLFLRERLLRDSDCTSMRVALELRVPLLDETVVDLVLGLSDADRFEPVGRKGLLRSAVAKELDASVFDRPKAGFELPLNVWCRELMHEEMNELFRDLNLCHRIGVNAEAVSRVWRAFQAGAPGLYWSRVWGLFTLLWWCRENRVYV